MHNIYSIGMALEENMKELNDGRQMKYILETSFDKTVMTKNMPKKA